MKAFSLRKQHYATATRVALVILAALTLTGAITGCRDAPAVGFKVRDWNDLAAVKDNLDRNIILMNDLDSTTAGYAELAGPAANQGTGWQPLGTWPDPFTGSFDGQAFEIRDLFIDRPGEDNVGLFSFVSDGATITSIALIDADVTGRSYVGALVGHNHKGDTSNCHSTGSVAGNEHVGGLIGENGGVVTNSYSSAIVNGRFEVGGLIGENHGTISRCYSEGSATGDDYVGGLVGWNRNAVSNSYSDASVAGQSSVGGLVGQNRGSVSSCYSTGSVTGLQDVGGLIGRNYEGTVSNSFWDVETSGMAMSAAGTGKTTAQMQDIATFTDTETEGLDQPWDVTAVDPGEIDDSYIWNIVDGETYPFLSRQPAS
jgi:hypothetical protein